MAVFTVNYLSPLGPIKISANTKGICNLELLFGSEEASDGPCNNIDDFKSNVQSLQCDSIVKSYLITCGSWLEKYFLGDFTSLTSEDILPQLDSTGQGKWYKLVILICRNSFLLNPGPFTVKVWQCLQTIQPGKTITYGELARLAGNAKAARAVGQVMKNNKVPLLLPCHRVVCADGSIGQYSGGCGTRTKEWLLDHEHVNHW